MEQWKTREDTDEVETHLEVAVGLVFDVVARVALDDAVESVFGEEHAHGAAALVSAGEVHAVVLATTVVVHALVDF